MPIYSPVGYLDITNATLRTSNLEAQNFRLNGGNIYVTSELTTNELLNLDNVVNAGNATSNTVQFTNPTTGLVVDSNIVVTGNVTAAFLHGDASNVTAVPAAQITGTLAVANGGTGTTTSTGTGSVVLSDAPTFTGDVTFDTNTLFVDSVNDKVGVGTTSPGARLHVYNGVGTVASEMILGPNAATDQAGIVKYFHGDGSGTGYTIVGNWGDSMSSGIGLVVKKGGNVGIGTTNPVGVNGGQRIEGSSTTGFEYIATRDDSTLADGDFIGGYLFKNADTNATEPHYAGMTAYANETFGRMDLRFFAGRDTYEDTPTVPHMTLDQDGNVGIGTTNPGYLLDVQSTSDAADKTMARLYSSANATGVSSTGLIFEKGTGYGGAIKGFISQGIGSGLSLHTLNGGTDVQAMTIMNSGNVGIGTTSPSATLDIYKEDTTAAGQTVLSSITGVFSGSDATGGNINNTGLFIDLDSSATGGTATNTEEHRVWGIDVDIDVTGDSDDIRGGRFLVRSELAANGSDQNTNIWGIDAQGQHNGSAPNTNIIGVNARSFKGSDSSGLTTNMIGVSAEYEINAGTCTDAYGVRARFDRNGGAVTNSYLFYGDHLGSATTITNNYGLYVTGADKHYLEGNVGIGTTNPKTRLHVNHDLHLQSSSEAWNTTAGKGLYLRYSTTGGQDAAYIQSIDRTNTSLSYPMIFEGSSYQFSVGNVGIGTTSPAYKLDVSGDIYASGNVTAYSDRRAKSNIEKIQNPLDKIDKISGYTYTMKVKDKNDPEKEKRFTGLIAQEVLEILPEAVMGSEENHYSLAYGNMAGLLVEAIKELSSELKTLKQKMC